MISKNYIKVFILFSLFAFLLPSTFVQAAGKSLIGVSTVYEERRGVNVEIGLFIHSQEKVASGSFDLVYDQAKMTVRQVTIGDQLEHYLTSDHFGQAGTVSVAWASAAGESLDGTLVTITARLSNNGETVDLNLKNVQLYKEDGSKIAVQLLNGQIKPFKGDVKKHGTKVKGDKGWTIQLSNEYDLATINNHTVRVKDSKGNAVDVMLKKRDNRSFIVSPKSNYVKGNYTIEITEQVRSVKGVKLKTPIKFEFSVE